MSRTAQSTERKKVTFVNNNDDDDVDKETLSAPHSSEMLSEQAILQSATPLSVLSNNSEGNGYSNKNKIGSLQPRRNSLQPIKNMNAIASHCVNFDQFLSSIKESNSETYLNNNCNSTTNGECDANAERILNVNNNSDNINNQNVKNRVNANVGKRVESKYRSNNSKRQSHQYKINALEDPYAPEHQGSVYSTIPELAISSQNEESRRSVNSINSNNTVNSNYSINKKNTCNYIQGSMHWHEYNSNYNNSCNGNDDNSNSNSLGSILYSQQPMRGKRLRSENLHHEEEEEELLHLSPIPSSTRKRHRLQPSCSLENTNNEESQERMHAIRQSRQSLSQYDQRLLDKYQSNIEKMNSRLHKMEKQLAEHLLPVSQEIADSKVKYDELCGKLGTIEQLLSQELKSTSTTSSVNSCQLAEESNSTKSALEEVKTEISKLCQVFTSMEQKVNALSSTSNGHNMSNINAAVAKETPSTLEKPQTPSPVLTLQPTQPREVQVVGEMISEHKNTNPFSFVKQDNEQKVNTTGNESGVVGDMNDFSSNDTTNKSTNFFTFGASTKNDSNIKNDRSNNESVGAADSSANPTLAFQQTTNELPTKDNANDAHDSKNNSTSTIFAPRTAETTPSFTSNDNNKNNEMTTSTTSANSSAANPFATALSKANTASSPFSFANATSNAATVANSSNNDAATTKTATFISDTSTNANANIGSTSNDTNNNDDHNCSNAKPTNPFTFASSTNNFNFGLSTAANNINAQDNNSITSPFFGSSSFAKNINPSPTSANPFAFSSTLRNPFSASTSVKDSEATNTLSNDATTMKAIVDDKSNSISNTADSANQTNPPTFGFGFGLSQVANTKTEKADTSNTPFAATNTFASAFGSKLADSTISSNSATSTTTTAFPFATPSTAPSLTSTSLPANNNTSNSATMTNPFTFNSTSVASSSANNNSNLNGLPTESSTPAFANTAIDNTNNTNLFSGFNTQSMTTSTSSSSSPFSSVTPANANTNNIFGNAALPSTGVNSFGAVNNSLGNTSNPFVAFGGGSNNNSVNNISGGNGGSGVVDTHILGTATRKKTARRY